MPVVLHHALLLLGMATAVVISGHLTGMVLMRAARVGIEEVRLYMGHPLLTLKTRWFPVTIGWLPIGGWIKMDMAAFDQCHPLVRYFLHWGGNLGLLPVAALCLPWPELLTEFTEAPGQWLRGFLSPFEWCLPLVRSWFERAESDPVTAFGILALKWCALNLIIYGIIALACLLDEKRRERVQNIFGFVVYLPAMLLTGCWMLAVATHFWRLCTVQGG